MHHLDRHPAVEAIILRQIDLPHRSPTDRREHLVAADRCWQHVAVGIVHEGRGRPRTCGRLVHRLVHRRREHQRLGQRRPRRAGVCDDVLDDERAEWIASQETARLFDADRFPVVGCDASHQADGQRAQTPCGTVDQMQFIGALPHRFQHRRRGAGGRGADHRVDDRLGVLDEVERAPRGIDDRARHFDEVWRKELAELLEDGGQGPAGCLCDRREDGDRISIGIHTRRQELGGGRGRARPDSLPGGAAGRRDVGELLEEEENDAVHESGESPGKNPNKMENCHSVEPQTRSLYRSNPCAAW